MEKELQQLHSLGGSELRYAAAVGRNKMRSLAALGTGGLSEIGRRAYNKTEMGQRSKLISRRKNKKEIRQD